MMRVNSPSDAEEFHLAVPGSTFEELQLALSPDQGPNADEGERGAFCVITESRGRDRVSYLIRDILMPEEGDVYYPSGPSVDIHDDSNIAEITSDGQTGLQYTAEYRRRARKAAATVDGGGLLIVHTHPWGEARPNRIDRDVAVKNLYGPAQELPPNVPFAAALYSEDGSWHVRAIEMNVARTPAQRESEDFGPHTAISEPATAIRVVGEELSKLETSATLEKNGPSGVKGKIDPSLVDSSRRIWGLDGQEELAGLRVGITGVGGGGSILAEWLARLGVGEIVLIDYDHLEPANFNRHQGARPDDIEERRLKVSVSARVAETAATATNFEVRPVVGSVVESHREKFDPLPHLLDCDVIFNASDMDWSRKVLDNLSFAHLIPVLDGGSSIDTDEQGTLTDAAYSTISLTGPEHVCLRCADIWKPDEVSNDMTDPQSRTYLNEDVEERAPSVVSFNGLVESLAIQRFQSLVLGVSPDLESGALRYFPNRATLRWRKGPDGELTECFESCERPSLTAGGEAAFSSTYRWTDPNLSEALEEGAIQESDGGVVEPAPSVSTSNLSENQEIDTAKENSLIARIRSWISSQ